MPKAQETVLEIDLKALQHNFNHLKSKLKPHTKFLAVVKAYAYGNNPCEIAKYLESLKVDYFAVAYINEGLTLRAAGIVSPILVLHPQTVNFNLLVEHSLEPALYNTKILEEFIQFAEKEKLENYPIHLKFNTGLNRLGFSKEQIDVVASQVKDNPALEVKSIFSHLAASEDLNEKDFTIRQIEVFKSIAKNFKSTSGLSPWLHMCNTSGILNYPEAHFDMVRSGIGLYGFGNSEKENQFLKPIGTLKTVISQIHHIKKGESVGYNRGFKSESSITTATLPIGHADGIGRQYGKETGYVMIHGKKAPIIGNVCMDMIMVNVTKIACSEGDEVIVFGKNETAEQLAETAQTISYELITSVSQRIKRIFIR
ncbi:alanine racemase [Tamlana fucoidanivorans]|uniref:Alanine racemase n=1 Tax=Allotamlana fucoidanivorans TaxID=2583814 RepID=A0A5C4ST18_9FLAO|nr:alanine racemase [Tamlana fucoidanivorans]TNJ47147.1 alanine racemase [Tamlana fucoidanivorans]